MRKTDSAYSQTLCIVEVSLHPLSRGCLWKRKLPFPWSLAGTSHAPCRHSRPMASLCRESNPQAQPAAFHLPFGLSRVDFLHPCAGVERSSSGCLACHKLSLSVSVMQRLQASPPWPYLSSPVISQNKWNSFFPILGKAVSS